MSMCPRCEKIYCDHTPKERGQTTEETHRNPTPKETTQWRAKQAVRLSLLAPKFPTLRFILIGD